MTKSLPATTMADPISEVHLTLLRSCCDLVEGVLSNHHGDDDGGRVSAPASDENRKAADSAFACDWGAWKSPLVQRRFQDLIFIEDNRVDDDNLGSNHGDDGGDESDQGSRRIDWEMLPPSVRPESPHCELNQSRAAHKRLQLQAMCPLALRLVDELYQQRNKNANEPTRRIHVVEFGAGSGHLGLLLAVLRPKKCHVTLIERKEYACRQAQRRVDAAAGRLPNVTVLQSSIHDFARRFQPDDSVDKDNQNATALTFDLGLALHSCGVLTDAALTLCLQQKAAFLLCPCCYGQLAAHLPSQFLPRSDALQALHTVPTPIVTPFVRVARAADCTTTHVDSANFALAKRSMQLVDADRLLWARQHGYLVHMTSLTPLSITPKNNIIAGMPTAAATTTTTTNTAQSTPHSVDTTALMASAAENTQAEAGERQKTGHGQFRTSLLATSLAPIVRTIPVPDTASANSAGHHKPLPLSRAYHITHAFVKEDLERLNRLRHSIPLDLSRPTCPRRFLTEKPLLRSYDGDNNSADEDNLPPRPTVHREDGWVGALIDRTVASWGLPLPHNQRLVSLPWYRYLEYTEPGGHMDRHTDGSNVHPNTGARSVATMLIYLSTCREGGETTLYHRQGKKIQIKQRHSDNSDIVERIRPVYNTALIFPHAWPHSGDPIVEDAKIALRVDLALV